jgi:hypothetical protein
LPPPAIEKNEVFYLPLAALVWPDSFNNLEMDEFTRKLHLLPMARRAAHELPKELTESSVPLTTITHESRRYVS